MTPATKEPGRSPSKEVDFTDIPLLADLDRIRLAELIPSFEQIHVKSGEILYSAGEPGDALFIIIGGIVRVFLRPGGQSLEIACLGPGDWFGELALLTGEPRTTDVEAQTDLTLLKLSRTTFNQLIKKYPSLGVSLAGLLAAKLASANVVMRGSGAASARSGPPVSQADTRITVSAPPVVAGRRTLWSVRTWLRDRRFLALCITLLLCVPSLFLLSMTGLNTPRITLFELLLAATILWSTNAFSFHTVSIGLPVVAVLMGATTPAAAFSGFSSSTWFLVLAVFGIAASIAKTGLLYRLTLVMMKRFPRNYFGQAFAVAFSGLLLTPIIPSPNGRLALASPLILTLTEILGYKKGSGGAVGLAMASFLGHGNMTVMFMNGSFVCFFMLGLLPADVSSSITWGYWFKASWLLSTFYFCSAYLAIIALYRPTEMRELVSSVTDAQLRTLGPLTMEEKVCLLTVLTSLAGFLTQSWHHIDGAWIAMLCLLILFATSVLDQTTLRTTIDWAFLISLGALIGFGNVIAASGLPEIVAGAAKSYLQFLVGSKLMFLLVITVSVVAIRFILPAFPSLVVCILALLPISAALEINPFVIGLVVLLVNEPWLLPHQSMIFQTLLASTEGRLFDHPQTVKFALIHVAVSLAAIAVSYPYWKYLGLIR
jgi:di/tricarboxylate transporter/CRP-like cAMP-binding protein